MRLASRVARIFALVPLVLEAPPAVAQGGLPPGAIATARAGASRPHITSVSAVRLAGAPGTCANRDAMVVLSGLNFPPASAGLRVALLRAGGGPLSTLVATSWSPARIDARLAAGVELEGETLNVGLVDARGEWQSNTDASLTICLRDAVFIEGVLRSAPCANYPRVFALVAQGPAARYERSISVPAHPGPPAPFRFDNVRDGTYGFTVTETTPPPVPPVVVLPPVGARSGALRGCDGPSLGFARATASIRRPAQRRATGVAVVEILLPPPALGPAFGSTPTPNPLAGSLPPPNLHLVLPTPTPTPAR